MTQRAVAATLAPEAGFDVRWREWQTRGAAQQRRLAARMRVAAVLAVVALAVWSYLQFA